MRLSWQEFPYYLSQRPHAFGIVLMPNLHPDIFQHHGMIARPELRPVLESDLLMIQDAVQLYGSNRFRSGSVSTYLLAGSRLTSCYGIYASAP